jgi:hypothetical protein
MSRIVSGEPRPETAISVDARLGKAVPRLTFIDKLCTQRGRTRVVEPAPPLHGRRDGSN